MIPKLGPTMTDADYALVVPKIRNTDTNKKEILVRNPGIGDAECSVLRVVPV